MQCQNFDKQDLFAIGAVGKEKTKNPGLDFHPSLIWQQGVASIEAEWRRIHHFTRLTLVYKSQLTTAMRANSFLWCFSMLQNYLSRPGYSLDQIPMGTFGCYTFPHTPHCRQTAAAGGVAGEGGFFSALLKVFQKKSMRRHFKERWRVKYYFLPFTFKLQAGK